MRKLIVVIMALISMIFILSACAKENPVQAPATIPAAIVVPSNPISILFDDCDDNDSVDAWGGFWFSYDDNASPNFGTSYVLPRKGAGFTMSSVGPDWPISGGPNLYAVRMSGQVNRIATYGYPFIGMGASLNPQESPEDFSNFDGISFWAKNPLNGVPGSIQNFVISLKTPISVCPDPSLYAYFQVKITPPSTWTQYKFNFTTQFNTPAWETAFPFGNTQAQYRVISMQTVLDLQMQTDTDEGNVLTPGQKLEVDFWIDNIYLYRD